MSKSKVSPQTSYEQMVCGYMPISDTLIIAQGTGKI